MTEFYSQENTDELIYDNSAFDYFLASICVILSCILFWKVIGDSFDLIIKQPKKINTQHQWIYKQKLATNKLSNKYRQRIKTIVMNIALLIICIAVSYSKLKLGQNNHELSGFDPYQILNIDIGASNMQIKKAFRKLALLVHPDKYKHDPLKKAQFILIQKAYRCLIDPQTKQNCRKFGNPDGQIAHKVGIGLPQFILHSENIMYVTIILLLSIFVIGPLFFFWLTNQFQQHKLSLKNKIAKKLFTPIINQTDFCILIGVYHEKGLKVFAEYIPKLTVHQLQSLKDRLKRDSNLGGKTISQISQRSLQLINLLLQFLENKDAKIKLNYSAVFSACKPLLQQNLRLASIKHYKKTSDLRMAAKNSKWFGIIPSKKILKYSWMLYNKDSEPNLQILLYARNLSSEERETFKKYNHTNLHKLISDPNQKKQFLSNFSDENKFLISEQLDCLPKISIESTVTIQDQDVEQIYKGDIAKVEVKIKKINESIGAIICKNYPYFENQEFVLIVSHNSVLYSYQFFNFDSNTVEIFHSFSLAKFLIKQGLLKLDISVWSLCYPNFVVEHQCIIQVFRKSKKKAVQIHQQDKNIEKFQKNFYQKLIEFNKPSQSDLQLSDSKQSQDQCQQQNNKRKKLKTKEKLRRKLKRKYQRYGIKEQQMMETQFI